MWALLIGAASWLVRTFLGATVLKFAAGFFLFASMELALLYMPDLLPAWFTVTSFTTAFTNMLGEFGTASSGGSIDYGAALAYFLGLFAVPFAVGTYFNAYVTRFLIRRLFR